MRLSHKNKITNKRNAKQLKFHNWFKQVKLLAEQKKIKNIELRANWNIYFNQNITPDRALDKLKIDGF